MALFCSPLCNQWLYYCFPGGSDDKACAGNVGDPWVGKIPWRRKRHPTPVLLPGKFHGLRSLVGYSPWGRKESDTTEQLHFSLSLSDIFTVYKNNSIFISTKNTPSGLRHSSPISKNQSRIQYSLLRILKKHLRIKFGAL